MADRSRCERGSKSALIAIFITRRHVAERHHEANLDRDEIIRG
jgi:hypothetical protein